VIDFRGIKLPDGEKHLLAWMAQDGQLRAGKPTYQLHKYEAALKRCAARRLAVDVGAHVGLWSRVMALDFDCLIAFEPVPRHIECWMENLKGHDNAQLRAWALGERRGYVNLNARTPGSCGDTGVARPGEGETVVAGVPMLPLDEMELQGVDLIKIDNEGFECFVVRGARQTLLRCRPVVIVEQKKGMGQRYGLRELQAVEELQELGMKLVEEISGDYILTF
jgi:FkbM family methyltransferase